ncbi:hypothetical protein B0T11DRAFT_131656 [Plectosphaerella cucumerina]|uniref:Uncharacterized protein n=1 Tax=Plectosphaerella cucumerina TaxID=40658 RepID=A0A8K0WZS9_9PEZI|nr:hypothetical protein B0T11DRAFT_131656 [Plectosphaerella cucumerina]
MQPRHALFSPRHKGLHICTHAFGGKPGAGWICPRSVHLSCDSERLLGPGLTLQVAPPLQSVGRRATPHSRWGHDQTCILLSTQETKRPRHSTRSSGTRPIRMHLLINHLASLVRLHARAGATHVQTSLICAARLDCGQTMPSVHFWQLCQLRDRLSEISRPSLNLRPGFPTPVAVAGALRSTPTFTPRQCSRSPSRLPPASLQPTPFANPSAWAEPGVGGEGLSPARRSPALGCPPAGPGGCRSVKTGPWFSWHNAPLRTPIGPPVPPLACSVVAGERPLRLHHSHGDARQAAPLPPSSFPVVSDVLLPSHLPSGKT